MSSVRQSSFSALSPRASAQPKARKPAQAPAKAPLMVPQPTSEAVAATAGYVSRVGLSPAMTNPLLAPALLHTQHNVQTGEGTDQKQSGRCWIFSGLNMLRQHMLKAYGRDFQYSQNYVAYWDKVERAQVFFDLMVDMSDDRADSQRVLNLIENLYTDGGEFELFRNVVLKHGLVPSYAMPETELAGKSDVYMNLLKDRVRELGGLLHLAASRGASKAALQDIKERAMREVRNVLNAALGTPPETFLWKKPGRDTAKKAARSKAKKGAALKPFTQLTPLALLAQNPVKLENLVHITNFPNHPLDTRLQVQNVNNVQGKEGLASLNLSMDEFKECVRNALRAGSSVLVSSEVKECDRANKVWARAADGTAALLGLDIGLRLGKGDRLRYRATVVAHGMLFTGCDDKDAKKYRGAPLAGAQAELMQPLWRVENSWKDNARMYMTDAWVDEYVYGAVVDRRHLTPRAKALAEGRSTPTLKIPAWDPFGRV